MPTKKIKKTKKQTLSHIAKAYVARFVAHKELVKRALFKWPKRILHEAHTKIHIIDKIKIFFGNISGSIWILIASGIFLLYAAWSTFVPKTLTTIAVHPASDTNKAPIIEQTQTTISAPITETQSSIIEDKNTVVQEPIVETQAPIVADTIQHIYTMYDAINDGSYTAGDYFDSYMQKSDLVKMYFTPKRLATLRAAIQWDISITSAEEFATDRKDRIGVRYILNYTLNTQQSFNETRSVTLRPQAWWWRIGTMKCETWWCSVNPFFNMEKYGIQ